MSNSKLEEPDVRFLWNIGIGLFLATAVAGLVTIYGIIDQSRPDLGNPDRGISVNIQKYDLSEIIPTNSF